MTARVASATLARLKVTFDVKEPQAGFIRRAVERELECREKK